VNARFARMTLAKKQTIKVAKKIAKKDMVKKLMSVNFANKIAKRYTIKKWISTISANARYDDMIAGEISWIRKHHNMLTMETNE